MAFLARRLLHSLFVLWAVVTILFLMFRLMPGNPLAAYIHEALTAEQQDQILRQFGLDQPLWRQYLIYVGNLAQGELGVSFHRKQPVFEIVMSVLPNTLLLTVTGVLIAYGFGVLMGAWLAWMRGTVVEGIAIPLALTTRAAPEFWLGMVLLAVFAFTLGWLPAGGANSPGAFFPNEWARVLSTDFLKHLALPALTMALYLQGLPLLLMRSTMLDVMHEEFVTMARMKGLSEWRIVIRHGARNALLPVVTQFSIILANTVGANVVIETVFSWPGLGRLLVGAVQTSDYALAQGAFFLLTVALITMNFIADLLYGVLDPRVSHERGG